METVPLSWHSKESLEKMRIALQREAAIIQKEHGNNSDAFNAKCEEISKVTIELFINKKS